MQWKRFFIVQCNPIGLQLELGSESKSDNGNKPLGPHPCQTRDAGIVVERILFFAWLNRESRTIVLVQ